MTFAVTAGTLGIGLLAVGTPLALVASLFRRRDRPGARSLLGVAVVLALGSLLHLLVADPIAIGSVVEPLARTDEDWWLVQGAAATVVAGSVWTPFAFAYTGRGGLAYAAIVVSGAIFSTAAIAVAALAATGGVAPRHVEALSACFLATAIVVAVGIGLLLLASLRQNSFPITEPLLLSAGAVALCSGVLLAQQLDAPWLYLAANALASGALLAPVRRYPMFDTLPAARLAGRDRVFETLATGVIVVDRDGRVRDVNERAAELFTLDPDAVAGAELGDLVAAAPDLDSLAGAATPVRLAADDDRTLELTARPIEGRGERPVGYVVLCSDVTERRVREERLALLRRFVVDVVGDRMDAVATSASAAAQGPPDVDDAARRAAAERIWTETTALTRLVAGARDVEREIRRDDAAATEADVARDRPALSRAVATLAESAAEGTGADVSVEAPERTGTTGLPRPLLRAIVPTVLADVCRRADRVDVAVTDGPAIEIAWTPSADEVAGEGRSGVGGEGRSEQPGESRSEQTGEERSEQPGETESPRTAEARADALHSLPVARLAIEQAGGTLSRSASEDGRELLTIGLPATGADSWASASRTSITPADGDRYGNGRLDARNGSHAEGDS